MRREWIPNARLGFNFRNSWMVLVDLVGIEPTTSSMPWKRAPSCATGPLLDAREIGVEGSTKFILAHNAGIVNARADQPRRTRRITKETFRKTNPSCNFVSFVVEGFTFSVSSICFH